VVEGSSGASNGTAPATCGPEQSLLFAPVPAARLFHSIAIAIVRGSVFDQRNAGIITPTKHDGMSSSHEAVLHLIAKSSVRQFDRATT